MIRGLVFFIFMAFCGSLWAESIKIKIVELYDSGAGFYIIGNSLSAPCLGQSLEFYFPENILDSSSVYEATNAFFENKPVSIVYSNEEQVCDDGQLYSMEVIADE
ncbi:hypothetical protein [Alloalcanivorax profundimaris]|uniref:hypothetical protein n=1 Tax=Alloalcanivorax profundimaris TaxID=2735259 RepID=UPI001887BF09|nr:hypothetical protein [Alloalcanivorax profundimaris]MBF1802400.1 hypothetical protein [Alloalcanivorax profundimaris]